MHACVFQFHMNIYNPNLGSSENNDKPYIYSPCDTVTWPDLKVSCNLTGGTRFAYVTSWPCRTLAVTAWTCSIDVSCAGSNSGSPQFPISSFWSPSLSASFKVGQTYWLNILYKSGVYEHKKIVFTLYRKYTNKDLTLSIDQCVVNSHVWMFWFPIIWSQKWRWP